MDLGIEIKKIKNVLRIVACVVALNSLFFQAQASSHPDCHSLFDFNSMSEIAEHRNFTKDRNLKGYFNFFKTEGFAYPYYGLKSSQSSFDLEANLLAVKSDGLLLNVGSGDGVTEQDLIQNQNFKGNIVGIDLGAATKEMTASAKQSNGRLKFINNQSLESLRDDGSLKKMFPNGVDIIIDLFASDTYSDHLDVAMETKLQLLKVGGVLATVIPTSSFGFNFSTVKVATRIRPETKAAIDKTQIQRRTRDYLKELGIEDTNIFDDELKSVKTDKFPSKFVEIVDLSNINDGEPDASVVAQGAIREMKSSAAGVLGWLEAIKGVEAISIEHPHEEAGFLVVFRKVDKNVTVPKLNLIKYNYSVGPPIRFYTW